MKIVRLMNGVTVKKKAWANHVIICLRCELINYICYFMDLIVVLSPLELHLLYTHNLKTLCSEYWKHLPVPIWMLTILGAHPFSGFLQGLFSCFLLFSKIFLFSFYFRVKILIFQVFSYMGFLQVLENLENLEKPTSFIKVREKTGKKFRNWWKSGKNQRYFLYWRLYAYASFHFFFLFIFFDGKGWLSFLFLK